MMEQPKIKLDLRKIPASSELFRPAKTDFSVVNVPTGTSPSDKIGFNSPETRPGRDEVLRKSSRTFTKPRYQRFIRGIVGKKSFGKEYLRFSVCMLIGTTIFWSFLGASYHAVNADQLVNSMLFSSLQDFHDTLLPNAHSFLMKWPLFLTSGLLRSRLVVILLLTILACVATVGLLAYILFRIEKRPVVIATIYLALSSMLLLVPAAPYAGALLPANMAMLATRNIEYIAYIAALYFVIQGRASWKSRSFLMGVLLLVVLFASDKLFVSLSVGGSLGVIFVYTIFRKWQLVRAGISWFIATSIAVLGASGALILIDRLQVAHIVSGGSALGPYKVVGSAHDLALGTIFGFFGILTNFGANPAFDALKFKDIPSSLHLYLVQFGTVGYILNALFLCLGLIFSVLLVRSTLKKNSQKNQNLSFAPILSVLLFASSAAAIAVFILSNHYYPVDSRYLTICFFAIVISATTYLKTIRPNPEILLPIGLITTIVIITSLVSATQIHTRSTQAFQQYNDRNLVVEKLLQDQNIQLLIGDYWRVIPIGQKNISNLQVSPLGSCTQFNPVLTSTAWQSSPSHTSFAYLVSLDKGLTGFPACSMDEAVRTFGQPSSMILIAGTSDDPKELLFIYSRRQEQINSAVPPEKIIPLERLTKPICRHTELNIVAHEDDDLIFMNPDISNSIDKNICVRTVYITAGDGGNGSDYWLGREKGAAAAYKKMNNSQPAEWFQRRVRISETASIIVASPLKKRNVSLIFMRLPDGGVRGEGFESSGYSNLSKLYSSSISSLRSVDGLSDYSNEQMVVALEKIMDYYKPNLIRTQSTQNGVLFSDHTDHVATSNFTQEAYLRYIKKYALDPNGVQLRQYVGYPARELPENIADEEEGAKVEIFLAYGQHDGAVCHSHKACLQNTTYNSYLQRQYHN